MTWLDCKWVIKVNQEIYGEIFCMDDDIIHWVQIRLVKKKLVSLCLFSFLYCLHFPVVLNHTTVFPYPT